jgi:hypothetical protein
VTNERRRSKAIQLMMRCGARLWASNVTNLFLPDE